MQTDFWHERWKKNEIGFHESQVNPVLRAHFSALNLKKGNRIFIPLCGKTLDIAWLLSQAYSVVGVELSSIAIEQLFKALEIKPNITSKNNILCYSAENIDIFVCDIFELKNNNMPLVDAIYDRAALVALPEDMRQRYTQHLQAITQQAPQLLVTFEYDQKIMNGPPFSISQSEINQHYKNSYQISLLESKELPEKLKGICVATEQTWLLNNEK